MEYQKAIDELTELIIELTERIELLEDSNAARKRDIQSLKNELVRIKRGH